MPCFPVRLGPNSKIASSLTASRISAANLSEDFSMRRYAGQADPTRRVADRFNMTGSGDGVQSASEEKQSGVLVLNWTASETLSSQ